MAEESVITKELRDLIGVEHRTGVFDVEKGHIIKFAQAIGDSNPLFNDPEYAQKSRYGHLATPPLFLIDEGLTKIVDILMSAKCPLTRGLNAGTEIDYYKPMKPGDRITPVGKLIDLQEKMGGGGKLLFMTVEVNYTNQDGELVAKCRNSFIRR